MSKYPHSANLHCCNYWISGKIPENIVHPICDSVINCKKNNKKKTKEAIKTINHVSLIRHIV